MTTSSTRFTVEGCKYYDSSALAIAEAKTMLYVSPTEEERALLALANGERVTLVYGFASVQITPPEAGEV